MAAKRKGSEMIIQIKHKTNPYVQIDKTVFKDKTLSWRAKGLLCYLLSKPPNWIVRMAELKDAAKEGRLATRTAFKELVHRGYIKLMPKQAKNGRMLGQEYWVFERPSTEEKTLTE